MVGSLEFRENRHDWTRRPTVLDCLYLVRRPLVSFGSRDSWNCCAALYRALRPEPYACTRHPAARSGAGRYGRTVACRTNVTLLLGRSRKWARRSEERRVGKE